MSVAGVIKDIITVTKNIANVIKRKSITGAKRSVNGIFAPESLMVAGIFLLLFS
jgi:hypothetical protein